MGARGNSGVILSQIVRGAADVARARPTTSRAAFRSASDAAYRAVKKPVEGTMLTAIRADGRGGRARRRPAARSSRAATTPSRATREMLPVLREAGVVDAGAAGLVEIVRGIAGRAHAARRCPQPPEARGGRGHRRDPPGALALPLLHGLRRRGRRPRRRRARSASSSSSATRCSSSATARRSRCTCTPTIPAARCRSASRAASIGGVEIANMHEQTHQREERLLHAVPRRRRQPARGRRGRVGQRATARCSRASARASSTAARR